jgi:cytochrome c oxidase subunit 3
MAMNISSPSLKHPGPPPADFGGGDNFGSSPGASRRAAFTGMVVLLAAVVMFFAAFTSALVVRRGLSDDWISFVVPRVFWVNAVVLIASSIAVEAARRALHHGQRQAFNRCWSVAAAAGLLFLVLQVAGWRELQAAGFYLATNPSSSFFYLLTVAHAVHLGGGLIALLYIEGQALALRLGPGKRTAVDVTAVYWHFLDGLWVYLLLLFRIWG